MKHTDGKTQCYDSAKNGGALPPLPHVFMALCLNE
jgi:hypothetical protein